MAAHDEILERLLFKTFASLFRPRRLKVSQFLETEKGRKPTFQGHVPLSLICKGGVYVREGDDPPNGLKEAPWARWWEGAPARRIPVDVVVVVVAHGAAPS